MSQAPEGPLRITSNDFNVREKALIHAMNSLPPYSKTELVTNRALDYLKFLVPAS